MFLFRLRLSGLRWLMMLTSILDRIASKTIFTTYAYNRLRWVAPRPKAFNFNQVVVMAYVLLWLKALLAYYKSVLNWTLFAGLRACTIVTYIILVRVIIYISKK